MKASTSENLLVRPVSAADVERLCQTLHRQMPRIGVDSWRGMFDYKWLDSKPNLGFVLTSGEEIVGFIGSIFAHRRINGKSGLICNHTTLFVLPAYGGWGLKLQAASFKDRSISYTNMTPTATTELMARRFSHAKALDTHKIVMPPFLHADTLGARRARIVTQPERVRALLDDEQRRIFDDHSPYSCLQLVIVEETERAFCVVKRRVKRYLPVSELLFCSTPALLVRHLERTKLAIMLRQRTLALVGDQRLFGAARPRGLSIKRTALFRSPIFDAHELDNLYSELVLLPI
jgi:acetoacetyl-CoA synthetase